MKVGSAMLAGQRMEVKLQMMGMEELKSLDLSKLNSEQLAAFTVYMMKHKTTLEAARQLQNSLC